MTVAEVKETLQEAGVNLNDAQFAAIQSLLGNGGGGGSDIDIMNVTNGASVELLTDPRIWFESNYYVKNYNIGETSLEDYSIDNFPGSQYCGRLRFHFSDEKVDINPFDVSTAFSDKPFPDALRVSADKIPYVIDLILHRFLDVDSQYGQYYNPNYLQITYMVNSRTYSNNGEVEQYFYTKDTRPFINDSTGERLSNIVNCFNSARKFMSIDNMIHGIDEEYELLFLNIDNEVFPNGEMVWIPFIGHYAAQSH